jgi:hypothetical protein
MFLLRGRNFTKKKDKGFAKRYKFSKKDIKVLPRGEDFTKNI